MSQTTLGHYVLGLGGFALLQRWYAGDPDAQDRFDRLVELANRASTDDLLQFPLNTEEREMLQGYTDWSSTYDGPNSLIEFEESICNPMLEHLAAGQPGGTALDAGCGTGRKARTLVDLGYHVIGCDLTPAMLDHARVNVPEADFHQGVFEDLPIDDASVDLVTSSLAVCHAIDLRPVFAEFARVLRPGGRVIVSDSHLIATLCGGQAFFIDESDMPFVRNQGRPIAEYFTAATTAGLHVETLHEAPISRAALEANPTFALYPELTTSALGGVPWLLVIEASKP